MTCQHLTIRALSTDGSCTLCDPQPDDTDELEQLDETALLASICRESFADFVVEFWNTIESHPYKPNPATTAIVTALQAVADGRIKRLILELCPGIGKTTLSALYVAYRLARNPSHRMLGASHAYSVVVSGLSKRARRVVESDRYQQLFGVHLRTDSNQSDNWETDANGRLVVVGVGGALTGFRANELIADDLINSIDAVSKAVRDTTWSWLGESFTTRLDGDGAIVVIGQRLGVDDPIGRLKSSGNFWTCLTLPAEFDPARRCVLHADGGEEIWRDSRTNDGELLAPDILSEGKLTELKASIGSQAFQSQYNEDPSSDENSSCARSKWRFFRQPGAPTTARRPTGCDESPPVECPKAFTYAISADLTFGSVKGDYAVIQVWGAAESGRYLLEHFRERCGFEKQLEVIEKFAKQYPTARVAVEKAANGHAVIETLKKKIKNSVDAMVPVGSKAQRLASVIGRIDNAQVFLPDGASYIADLVEEFHTFPGRFDDQVDCAVWGLIALEDSSNLAAKLEAVATKKAAWLALAQKHGIELPYVFTHGKRI